ncbi:endothelin-1 [Megalops cyprinoides]|uniref:endothelin-1 n=1 Tax=Megalops cyprinoides TaxID=118141 RepID=UPI0018649528|nr:endothelin-1 [Megalops cyprinoides]
MELRITFSVIYIIFSGCLHTVTPAPMSEETASVATTSPSAHHTRTKRCSCATFLDKECVYFCHLDIIWINTPERTVSYGLGSAPRKKRSLVKPFVLKRTEQKPRCKCVEKEDRTCATFCQQDNPARLRAAKLPTQGSDCAAWQCVFNLQASKREIKRVGDRSSRSKRPSARRSPRGANRRRWARAWEDENAAS